MSLAFIFVILGTKTVRSDAPSGLRVRRSCPACGMISEMREQRWRNYFTIFFIPLIPLGKGRSALVCSRCESAFPLEMGYEQPQKEIDAEIEIETEKTTITCRYCDGRLRVPVLTGKTILVTCPHCRQKFEITQ